MAYKIIYMCVYLLCQKVDKLKVASNRAVTKLFGNYSFLNVIKDNIFILKWILKTYSGHDN
jgi:hypothetical protein